MEPEPTVQAVPAESLRNRLAHRGEQLPPRVRSEILRMGSAIVPDLVRILDDDLLATEGSDDDGWAAIHAAGLLIDLKAPEAVEVLVSALSRTHWEELLHELLIERLPELGSLALEPLLSALEKVTDPEDADALCSVVADLGVRDERVFARCVECYARNPGFGAILLGDYGDPRGLPLLRRGIEQFAPDADLSLGSLDLEDHVDSYERIAGELPDDLAAHVAALREALDAPAKPFIAPPKVGRNDPCPCGSGKKFKKCCGAG